METIIISSVVIYSLTLISIVLYLIYNCSIEKNKLVEEITKSMLARKLDEYMETVPEPENEPIKLPENNLQDINEVNEEVLIKHLNEEYED